MGTITPFFPRGLQAPETMSKSFPEILEVIANSFPGSPEFSNYLAGHIAPNGSLELARILCLSLRECFTSPPPIVSAECVGRLSVEIDIEAIGRINSSYLGGPFTVIGNALVFLTRASGTIEVPSHAETMDDLEVIRRPSFHLVRELKGGYQRLFFCAHAMLAGLKVDPRKKVA